MRALIKHKFDFYQQIKTVKDFCIWAFFGTLVTKSSDVSHRIKRVNFFDPCVSGSFCCHGHVL